MPVNPTPKARAKASKKTAVPPEVAGLHDNPSPAVTFEVSDVAYRLDPKVEKAFVNGEGCRPSTERRFDVTPDTVARGIPVVVGSSIQPPNPTPEEREREVNREQFNAEKQKELSWAETGSLSELGIAICELERSNRFSVKGLFRVVRHLHTKLIRMNELQIEALKIANSIAAEIQDLAREDVLAHLAKDQEARDRMCDGSIGVGVGVGVLGGGLGKS